MEKDKAVLKDLCNKIIDEKNVDGIILGCTELPLILNDNDFNIEVLDTTAIHVKSILEEITKNEEAEIKK
jgi:aspartate racemase